MRKRFILGLTGAAALALSTTSQAVVVDFVGGTAYFAGGGSAPIALGDLYTDSVDYYEEDGIRVDFVGGYGTIGNYYSIGLRPDGSSVLDNVIHAHWAGSGGGTITSIVFSKADGSDLDLNYMDLTSNTVIGGGQSDGTEVSHITSSKGTTLLPSSDWGYDFDFYGAVGDGIERLYLNDNFDGISSFAVTSDNAYCFGLDNFYIDEPPPPPVGVPDAGSTAALLALGVAGLLSFRRRAQV